MLACLVSVPVVAQQGGPTEPPPGMPIVETEEAAPQVERLGEQGARIGAIRVDRREGRIEIPGRVIRLDPPLEFLAVKRHGYKAYESLLELDATAVEINTACILIGLSSEKATHPAFQSQAGPVGGDPVRIRVSWEVDGEVREVEASRLLQLEGAPVDAPEWVYTGSAFTADGRYLAALEGPVISFMHDPASIIEHRSGLGLQDYGAVAGSPAVSPPVGTTVTVTIEPEGVAGAAGGGGD